MAGQDAEQDRNDFPALLGHSGTAGTAETRRIVVTSTGAITTDQVEVTDFNGGTVSVGTAAVELTFTGVTQSIMITSDFGNGTIVYLGGSAVTQAGANAITFLQPDQSVTIGLNDDSAALYAVGGTTGQKVYKVALT